MSEHPSSDHKGRPSEELPPSASKLRIRDKAFEKWVAQDEHDWLQAYRPAALSVPPFAPDVYRSRGFTDMPLVLTLLFYVDDDDSITINDCEISGTGGDIHLRISTQKGRVWKCLLLMREDAAQRLDTEGHWKIPIERFETQGLEAFLKFEHEPIQPNLAEESESEEREEIIEPAIAEESESGEREFIWPTIVEEFESKEREEVISITYRSALRKDESNLGKTVLQPHIVPEKRFNNVIPVRVGIEFEFKSDEKSGKDESGKEGRVHVRNILGSWKTSVQPGCNPS